MSYIFGLFAALPELAPETIWPATRRVTSFLCKAAPDKGRFADGYDRIADFTTRHT